MPTVEINNQTVTIERFTLAKAMRVITLLQLLQKQVPEISKRWAEFRKTYAQDYATELERNHAMILFPELHDRLTEADWERAGQKHRMPGSPSQPEIFFEMAPLIYEKAEEVTLRLLGLIVLDNETVNRYVKEGEIWGRVDEVVDKIIRPAGLDEIMELCLVAAEVIDGQVLQKAKTVGARAGNVARLLGWTTEDQTTSGTSSASPGQPNTESPSATLNTFGGPPTPSSDSPGTSSSTSRTSSNENPMSSEPLAAAS